MRVLRAFAIAILLIVVALVALSYVDGAAWSRFPREFRSSAVGTSGTTGTSAPIDTAAARERGAEVGEKVAVAADKVKDAAEDGAITSKIKAKMVLDDSIQARTIEVTTRGTTVTLGGTVRSATERERAVSLVRETAGVSTVIDRLRIER
jgi:hyperosmotically inducible periplasmic protein